MKALIALLCGSLEVFVAVAVPAICLLLVATPVLCALNVPAANQCATVVASALVVSSLSLLVLAMVLAVFTR